MVLSSPLFMNNLAGGSSLHGCHAILKSCGSHDLTTKWPQLSCVLQGMEKNLSTMWHAASLCSCGHAAMSKPHKESHRWLQDKNTDHNTVQTQCGHCISDGIGRDSTLVYLTKERKMPCQAVPALCCMGEASRLCATQHSAPSSLAGSASGEGMNHNQYNRGTEMKV